MSGRHLPNHEVDVWWSGLAEPAETSDPARDSCVTSRRTQAWAMSTSVVHAYDPRGRVARVPGAAPVISGTALELTLAYAGSFVAIAVSRQRRIGIDAEPLERPVDDSLARHVLSGPERESLALLPAPQRREALLRAWVRKEAVLKAAGVGLLVEPALVDVGVARSTVSAVVVPGGGPFRLVDLRVPGFVGAVAAGGEAPIRVRWCGPAPTTVDETLPVGSRA